jgi:hypothetical protein
MKSPYAAFALMVFVLYGLANWYGWGFSPGQRGLVPPDVRQSPGGYRSYGFWRGGK